MAQTCVPGVGRGGDAVRKTIIDAIGEKTASHFGHGYERLAPLPKDNGKPDVERRDGWLDRCEGIRISDDYKSFYTVWERSFQAGTAQTRKVKTVSRLLVGHGNPSGADVGLTVHHTWSVPMIPGSALKGLLAHHVDAVYGGSYPTHDERRKWRGPIWKNRQVAPGDGAGVYFAMMLGAPAVTGDPTTALRGVVEIHDALYVPGSVALDCPFVRDVLTVHQKPYYDEAGKNGGPTDWDDPNPVGFMTVTPGVGLLLAVTGPDDWTELTMRLLYEALAARGVGGKTSAGYGRMA